MSQDYLITTDQIFQATSGGLDIIRYYISDIDSYVGVNKKFALREEKTPSCTVKRLTDGNYVVTDFGDEAKPMNGITFTMNMERCTYGEAISIIAERHGITGTGEIKSMYEATRTVEDAKPDQTDGDRIFNHAEEFSEAHLRIIFSKAVWSSIEYEHRARPEAERKEAVLMQLRAVMKEQHWHSLDSQTIIKNRKAITFAASEFYPIIRIEEERKDGKRFSKIYQPRHKDKGRRFFYHGDFDAKFLHGWDQVKRARQELITAAEGDEKAKEKDPKLELIFYCTGGSDALNLRALGYHVVYPSSEHFKLSKDQLHTLHQRAHFVYTCPDMDYTGQKQNHRLCINPQDTLHLDIRTVELPQELQQYKDQYQRPCKDLRDYLNHFRAADLRNIISVAKMYRFWDGYPSFGRNGEPKMRHGVQVKEYKLSMERVLNFLVKAGFGRRKVNDETIEFIQIDGNLVRQVKSEDIKAYLVNFLRSRYMHEDLLNVVHRSPNLSEKSFDALPMLNPDFKDYDNKSQYLFFQNITWKITADEITEIKNEKVDKMVWESRILPYKVKKKEPMFTVNKASGDKVHIDIHNQESMFFRFLMQTSRVHWRKELEDNLENMERADADAYVAAHKFTVHGPNLTDQERQDQEQHLVNKMYAFGYLMHRYKFKSRPWIVFGMDDTPQKDNESNGGTGKSILFEGVRIIKNMLMLDGKNDDIFKDNHVFENVTTNTDVIYVDDLGETFPMRRTFSMATGDVTVNPKGKTRTAIKYDSSPKMGVTSNFSPDNLEPSTMRRLLFFGTANWYHGNSNGLFNEKRQPVDDFGKEFWSPEYSDDDWNADFNFMAQCCQLYLQWPTWIEAPMANIMDRSLSINMGFNFLAWAEVFFSEESSRLDCFVPAEFAKEDYKSVSGIKTITTNGFNGKMKMYAQMKKLGLNPKSVQNKDGRVLKNLHDIKYDNRERNWIKTNQVKTQSMIYLQADKENVYDRVYDPTATQIPVPTPVPGTEAPDWTK